MADKLFTCSDGYVLSYNLWLPSPNMEIKAFLQIIHGMAEHSDRYARFAEYLNKLGYAVFCADLRGHGAKAPEDELGWFGETGGWERIAADTFEIANHVTTQYDASMTFLLGHSLGSFLATTVLVEHPDFYSGGIIMGTGCSKGLIGKMGKLICKGQIRKNGSKGPGVTMNKLSFGAYNKAFEPTATDFDWLSRDAKEVEKYVKDPRCGFLCTNGLFYDLLSGIEFANNRANIRKLPKDIPILLISGDQDPVGDFGKGVRKVYDLYVNSGMMDVKLELIPGARHEILNETNRKEVYGILASWLDSHI